MSKKTLILEISINESGSIYFKRQFIGREFIGLDFDEIVELIEEAKIAVVEDYNRYILETTEEE